MDAPVKTFVRAGSLEELKAKGRLVVRGAHRPILVVYDRGRVLAFDNRCPHMGFPLDRGSIEDGILTCHWHHARFDLASGCTFDLWADDAPTCPTEVRDSDVWVKPTFGQPTRRNTGADGCTTASPTTSVLSSPRRFPANSPPACPPRTALGRSYCSARATATAGASALQFLPLSPISYPCCPSMGSISRASIA